MAGPTVLLVDDDPLVRELFGEALRAAGYTVVAVANGREALAELGRARFDVIVTDLFMPEVDGLELLRVLRRQRSPIPVVAISAGGELEQTQLLQLARALGARRILEKPLDVSDLLDAVAALLAPERAGAAAPSYRVLLADDDPAVVPRLRDILERDGHHVDVAHGGRASLEKLASGAYDVVVSDLSMSALDAIALYEEIVRRHPALAPRVVFLTAPALEPPVSAFLDRTGALTLQKPVSPAAVRTAVRHAAARR